MVRRQANSLPRVQKKTSRWLSALVADAGGEVIELEGYAATGMAGREIRPLLPGETKPMPYGSEVMLLPDRHPVLYNTERRCLEILTENPYVPNDPIYPVSVFNSPGYAVTQTCAYRQPEDAPPLPAFFLWRCRVARRRVAYFGDSGGSGAPTGPPTDAQGKNCGRNRGDAALASP